MVQTSFPTTSSLRAVQKGDHLCLSASENLSQPTILLDCRVPRPCLENAPSYESRPPSLIVTYSLGIDKGYTIMCGK